MRIIRRRSKRPVYALLVLVLVACYAFWALNRALPLLQPESYRSQITVNTGSSTLAWPAAGQSAVSILGTDILETHGPQKPAPTASVAKVITALTVLDKKPLAAGQQGPAITLSPSDVALFHNYAAEDGSLVPVSTGEKISQYQMLQAMMLPSANNVADSLAIWAYGSLSDYATAANAYLAAHDLKDTHVGNDASGLSPTTTSTASDLVKLGQLAMQNQVLASIAGQSTATGIPMTTIVKNVNQLLGTSGIVGIKTGNSDPAGGVFLSASKITVNGKPVTVITAVEGSPTLFVALKDSLALVRSAQANFVSATIVKAGDKIGSYKVPWSTPIPAVASKDLTTTAWKGSAVKATATLQPLSIHDVDAGKITLPDNSVAIKLQRPIPKPSAWWRLSHPL